MSFLLENMYVIEVYEVTRILGRQATPYPSRLRFQKMRTYIERTEFSFMYIDTVYTIFYVTYDMTSKMTSNMHRLTAESYYECSAWGAMQTSQDSGR
jgi:hypothetical protein